MLSVRALQLVGWCATRLASPMYGTFTWQWDRKGIIVPTLWFSRDHQMLSRAIAIERAEREDDWLGEVAPC